MSDAKSVGALIEDCVARGVFRATATLTGPTPTNRESYRLVWFRQQEMNLEVDASRGRVTLSEVLPAITARSKLDRQLRAWLSDRQAPELPAHRRIDPAEFHIELRNRAGSMQLSIVTLAGDTALAARKLFHLVTEIYLVFLTAAERYDWLVETFNLDPDNPRFP